MLRTLRFRVKDKHKSLLSRMAIEINQVWNYCNSLQIEKFKREGKFLSKFDFNPFIKGAGAEFNLIGYGNILCTAYRFAEKRKAANKVKLRVRKSFGPKRSLGWIPFVERQVQDFIQNKVKIWGGRKISIWDSHDLKDYDLRSGCFVEDAKGDWYLCITVKIKPNENHEGAEAIGIDLGLKNIATCSDGTRLQHGRWYRTAQSAIGRAQRARKKKRVRNLHRKVKNQRRDTLHKFSRSIVNRAKAVFIGDVKPLTIGKTRLAKSVYDSGWGILKNQLLYKGQQASILVREVSERFSSQTCSRCWVVPRSSPKGRAGLGIREWKCSNCGAVHDRDVNAAQNILEVGHGLLAGGSTL